MNYFKSFHLFLIPLVLLTTCHFPNFYSDPDDQGLSRLTSRGYNVASLYINNKPFRDAGSPYSLLQKDSTGNSIDTLRFAWQLYPNDFPVGLLTYRNISFGLPVPSSFNKSSLLGFNGQRFSNSVPITLQDSALNMIAGTATLYFVSVSQAALGDQKYIKLSGLFEGKIGDSVLITKGRFDFQIDENTLNF